MKILFLNILMLITGFIFVILALGGLAGTFVSAYLSIALLSTVPFSQIFSDSEYYFVFIALGCSLSSMGLAYLLGMILDKIDRYIDIHVRREYYGRPPLTQEEFMRDFYARRK